MFHLVAQPQNPLFLLFESRTGQSKCLTPQHAFAVSSISLTVTVTHRRIAALQYCPCTHLMVKQPDKERTFLAGHFTDCFGVNAMSQERAPSVQVTAKLTGGWARGDG